MARGRILILIAVFFIALGAVRARDPYVHKIEKEEGSLGAVVVEVTSAEQARVFAQGYKEWNLPGRKIYLEGTARNRSEGTLAVRLTFSARDVFGKALNTCETGMMLSPGEEEPFTCVLLVKDVRDFYEVTYKAAEWDRGQ